MVSLLRHETVLLRPTQFRRNLTGPLLRLARHIFTPLPREELITGDKSRLRDRPYLPGSSSEGFPEFLAEPRELFPRAVQVQSDQKCSLKEAAVQCREYIEQNLANQGAILFRSLPLSTAEDFSTFVKELGYDALEEEGYSAYRHQVDPEAAVYTSSDDPQEATIEMHSEMAYKTTFPCKLFFWCLQEPGDGCGGETPLVKNSELLSKLDPDVTRKFEEKDILYWRHSPDKSQGSYLNWQGVFGTEDRKVAEKFLTAQNYSFKWDEGGNLHYWQILPAVWTHPTSRDRLWFNQAHAHHNSYFKHSPLFDLFDGQQLPDHLYPYHSYYGDGSEIEPDVIQHIRAVIWKNAVGFRWRNGDLLTVDNMAVQHGRISFTGPRKVLAYLTRNCKS